MGYLKTLWRRKYQIIVMSDEGGWTRSYPLTMGRFTVLTGILLLVVFGLLGGLLFTVPRVTDYDELMRENMRLQNYRNKVRRALFNADDYGLVSADLLQDLGLSIHLGSAPDDTTSRFDSRQGGVFIDDIYINFLDNVPTFPPVNGYVTRGQVLHDLDLQPNHVGIDIAARLGDEVKAAAAGLVVFSHWTEDLGYTVILSHNNGYYTIYGHNQRNLVSAREWVERGATIGYLGNTGISQGPHLHFEIWKEGRSLNPQDFIDIYRTQDVSVETHGEG